LSSSARSLFLTDESSDVLSFYGRSDFLNFPELGVAIGLGLIEFLISDYDLSAGFASAM
jgi:hypothetical protein